MERSEAPSLRFSGLTEHVAPPPFSASPRPLPLSATRPLWTIFQPSPAKENPRPSLTPPSISPSPPSILLSSSPYAFVTFFSHQRPKISPHLGYDAPQPSELSTALSYEFPPPLIEYCFQSPPSRSGTRPGVLYYFKTSYWFTSLGKSQKRTFYRTSEP